MASFFSSLLVVLQPLNLLALFACSVIGAILGAIPGLSGGMGITLILPLTFAMTTELSFAMLLGMYVGGVSGAFIAAVLVGIPGSASAIATCYDGYPMTKQGKAAKALSIGITGSFIGTFFSVLVAVFASKFLANIAMKLGPWEYFSLCFMAVSLVIGLGGRSIYKSLIAAFMGLFLATIGTDQVSNQMRFTFRNYNLIGGISVIALLMGTFALQQVAMSHGQGNKEMPKVDGSQLGGFGLTARDFKENIGTIIRGFLIGLGIGFLPGLGGGVANMIAYSQAKKSSKNPDEWGKGHEGGVWISEVSNNASIGGAIIPMLALGIPGDGTTVMLLSALTIHGLQAGPLFIGSHPDLANMIFAALLLAAVLVFVVELLTKRWFPKLLNAPYHYLYGAIVMICFMGAFASGNTMFGVYQALVFCVFGILMMVLDIPMSPLMLSYILGQKLEYYFRLGCSYAEGNYFSFFTRPISCIFLLIGLYSLFSPLIKKGIEKAKARKTA